MMTKKARVLVLYTENKTHLLRNTYKFTPEHGNPWEYRSQILEDAPNRGYEFNHLYFTVNEVPEGNEWYITTDTHDLLQCTSVDKYIHSGSTQSPKHLCKKVVATTNPDLWISRLIPDAEVPLPAPIAKIPTDFLEAYVREQGKITEVLLEYDKFMCNPSDPKSEGVGEGYMLGRGYIEHGYYTQLKLRPNGTVIIHPVNNQEKIWRDVFQLFADNMIKEQKYTQQEWLEVCQKNWTIKEK